jgi:hypothetical protein
MREVELPRTSLVLDTASFLACLATILELPIDQLPQPVPGDDAATGWTIPRWLGGLGLGLVRVADPSTFSWAGPWIARVSPPDDMDRRYVVMYGVPSGVVWDPGGEGDVERTWIDVGFVVAAADIALARPARATAPQTAGTIEAICVAAAAGEPVQHRDLVQSRAGRGLAGDRHVTGTGTFPSGVPGSALTLIEAEVCGSFDPPLGPDEHRRNLVTRGIDLNGLVGREFTVGSVRCRGMRLCEPCLVMERYASRPVLRALVHRGGLRADILSDGELRCGDSIQIALPLSTAHESI